MPPAQLSSPPATTIWPADFRRVPADDWVSSPIEDLAAKYDTVEQHGWYRNLDPTVAALLAELAPGSILLDYSGGTGILAARLLHALPELPFGILIADASPKFLRLALEKLGKEERVAFRLLHYLKAERRLETVTEVLSAGLLARGVDTITSTNAIHLYYDLEETLTSWRQVLKAGGRAFIQSGNIGLPRLPAGAWIIDATVEAIHHAAVARVESDVAFRPYRAVIRDPERLAAYTALRRKIFLPVRPLDFYLGALRAAGFNRLEVEHRSLDAAVDDWRDFLSAYHEGVLGWVGGVARIESREPPPEALVDRHSLLALAMNDVFAGRQSFQAVWTYITAG